MPLISCTPQRAHVTELAQLGPEWKLEEEPEPVVFLKPTTSYAFDGSPVVLPARRPGMTFREEHGVHHELELAVIIGSTVRRVASDKEAMDSIAGFVLALDITGAVCQHSCSPLYMSCPASWGSR